MSYDATGDAFGYDGQKPTKPARVIGSFLPIVPFVVSGLGASTATDTITVTFPSLKTIQGWTVDAYDLSTGTKASDDAILVTASGNVLTIVEASGGIIEANRYQGLVWGNAKLL